MIEDDDDIQDYKRPWVGLTETERNGLEDYCEMIIGKAAFDAIEAKLKERNFCPRCGKRTNDIHTCTPPKGAA